MRHELSTILLGPLLLRQGRQVRQRVALLPEPDGERQGVAGEGPPLRVLIIGDSAGAGVGAATQTEALSGRMVAELAGQYKVHWQLMARSGATLAQTVRRLRRLDAEPWDWVVVSLGVNDVVARTTLDVWRQGLSGLRDLLREKFQQPRILFSGLPPMHLFPALPQPLRWYLGARARDFDAALAAWADSHADCVRLATDFSHDPALMARDGFHPGPGLYRLWGQAVASQIKRHQTDPIVGGRCERCRAEHRLAAGVAREQALLLMRELDDRGRIDVGAEAADPRFSTDYLFGEARGQMFGVLVGEDAAGGRVVLRAFSGQYNGVWEVPGWVPPLFSVAAHDRIMIPGDHRLKLLDRRISDRTPDAETTRQLRQERKRLSQLLMKDLHALYEVRSFNGETRPLSAFFAHARGIPAGAGDCCAPKLLNEALRLGLRPLGLAEFYWGRPNRSGSREHGRFYGSCADKCGPLLGFMLCGVGK